MRLGECGSERSNGEAVVRRETVRSLVGNQARRAENFAFGEANLRDAQVKGAVRAAAATKHDGDSRQCCFEIFRSEY